MLATAIAAIAAGRSHRATRAVYALCLVASGVALATSVFQLLTHPIAEVTLTLPIGLPWLGAHFRIDALAEFFLAVVNLGGVAASLYALGYGIHEPAPHRVLPFVPAFLAGMNVVLLASDAFTFLLAWEFMSLASWALVMAHHREEQNTRSGYIYFVMANFGTLALLLAFGVLAGPTGQYEFSMMQAQMHSPLAASGILLLVLLGAGSKAGIVPLHVWLPLAHPAAPSHVSALMSGVMTKVAVYAFVRIVFDLLGESSWWDGALVLLLGGITAVLGVLYALMQHDLKRLLAYHTVENIGIIFIGLGLALSFQANGMNAAAALAFTAALLHVFNHSLFKSVLFFGAGAVQSATHERDMENLGGLIHRMPATSFIFLVACVAISALPPLNGFVSEWLTFQAIVQSPVQPQWVLRVLLPAVGALLALSAALAAACFVKAFGVTFLGRPRSEAAANAKETDIFSLTAMAVLALLCLVAGILPGFFIDAISPVAHALVADHMPAQSGIRWLTVVPITEGRSSYNGLLLFTYLVFTAAVIAFLVRRLSSRAIRRSPAWDCGYPEPSTATQYTGTSFAQPIRRVFGTSIFRARERVVMPPPGDMQPATLVVSSEDRIWDAIYAPIAGIVSAIAGRLNQLQFLTIRRYLSLVFASLVILLMVVALWG